MHCRFPLTLKCVIADYQNASGWYKASPLNLVKNITRLKFMYIREKNAPAPDEICLPAIQEFERSKRMKESDRYEENEHGSGQDEAKGEEKDDEDEGEDVYAHTPTSDVEMEQ